MNASGREATRGPVWITGVDRGIEFEGAPAVEGTRRVIEFRPLA
jgi:hypothetical protein